MFNNNKKRRTSLRGQSSKQLARSLLDKKKVVFITGAGLSVASGIRPFRGTSDNGLWEEIIWKTATRSSFRKNPLIWYNEFWLPHFHTTEEHKPNEGHRALTELKDLFPHTCHIITQNIDGLHENTAATEAHGRIGLYKCIPEEDSGTDSEDDEDESRLIHLGHRRKSRISRQSIIANEEINEIRGRAKSKKNRKRFTLSYRQSTPCRYQQIESIRLDQIRPLNVRYALKMGKEVLPAPPTCPSCGRPVPPQALLFDESYHSHDFYQFEKMEDLISDAEVLVFVGTSFQVHVTEVALDHAREHAIPVYNFNTKDVLEPSARLNVENIIGKCHQTLPQLLNDVKEIRECKRTRI